MKTHWFRSVLLGVSLAFLLAGGVALALALTVTVDQDCFECWPAAAAGPDEDHIVRVTLDDYSEADLCMELYINGALYATGPCEIPDHAPPCEVSLWVDCPELALHTAQTCFGDGGSAAGVLDAGVANGPVQYGDWLFRAWQEVDEDPVGPVQEVAFRFAEACEVEFVPEPASILLLGTGLAGLAGYATLRWRGRE